MTWKNLEHNSPEWIIARLGIPTSSEFKRIITPGGADGKNPKVSEQAEAYMHRLLAEWITGVPSDSAETEWMTRGLDMQDEAIKAYEFEREVETDAGGFALTDDGLVGASPDRRVGADGLLEIKCPAPQTHVGYMLNKSVEAAYRPQLQGQLWVCERAWVDIYAYHPRLPGVRMRVYRDERYISQLAALMSEFVALLIARRALLEESYGPFVRPQLMTDAPVDADTLGVSDADVDAILAARKDGNA